MSSSSYKGIPVEGQGWEAFTANEPKPEAQDDWVRAQIPSELQIIQDESNVPEKLRQILAWSLMPTSAPPKPHAEASYKDLKGKCRQSEQDIDNGNELLQPPNINPGQSAVLARRIEQDAVPEHRGVFPGSHARPLLFFPRSPSIPYFASYSAIGSTFDFATTGKTKVEADQFTAMDTKNTLTMVECISCFDEFPKARMATLICTHSYCKTCLTALVTTALQTEASYPPKCCLTAIPTQTALLSLSSEQRQLYRDKAAEYTIPPSDRWYCPNAKCLKWIPPGKLSGSRSLPQTCPHCRTRICGICRGLAHTQFTDCPQDFDLEATIKLAELEGWRRCFKCRAMVERYAGCRHMICNCGAQFCYVCGTKWLSCGCTEADERNRQVELGRLRLQTQTARDAEAAEVARAIAEVEDFERRQAGQRRQEDTARRLNEERLERGYRESLRRSVDDACRQLQSALDEVMQVQRMTLDSRHVSAEQQHFHSYKAELTKQTKQNEELLAIMESNINNKTKSVEDKQKAELAAFDSEQEELEDDLFLEIRLHLRGKYEEEARKYRPREKFKRQQDTKREELLVRHRSELDTLKANTRMELKGVERASNEQKARLQKKYEDDLGNLRITVAADRAWFNFLAQRRRNMVSANNRLMLEALEARIDPVGLTEEEAMTIDPYFPSGERPVVMHWTGETKQEQSQQRELPLAGSPSPFLPGDLVELATTSRLLLESLESELVVAESSTRNAAAVPSDVDTTSANNTKDSMTESVYEDAMISQPVHDDWFANSMPMSAETRTVHQDPPPVVDHPVNDAEMPSSKATQEPQESNLPPLWRKGRLRRLYWNIMSARY